MEEIINNFIGNWIYTVLDFFNKLVPDKYKSFIGLGIFIVLITIYAIFVWKFYRFLGKRDLLELNLSQYNYTDHSIMNKFLAVLLFIIEYIIILPVVVFFWFVVMAIILLVLAKEQTIGNILLISAVIVGAIRITAYYKEDLSKDLAKMFPFTILVVAILTPGFFDLEGTLLKLSNITNLFSNISIYLIIIALLEFTLRIVNLIMVPFDTNKNENNQ